MKKIFLSFLLVMAGISHTLAQGLDGNVEQRLKDFFTRYETSYANIGKCKLDRYEVNHDKKRLNVYASPSFGYQPFTIPYIIPMLENAGAIVYTPRERDWQRNEVIVDNDTHPQGCIYQEIKSRKGKWKTAPTPAFAQKRLVYRDGQNPFEEGTARFASTEKKPEKAFAQWIPHIPETGKYAVYVTYQTLPGSVSDAKYLVFHKGGVTEFLVNQQIGGGTWVYLGTFEFDKGTNDYGMVVLSNESRQKGVVCADAVRFGGGMGNISRGGKTSGLPRYLEGARYAAQWSGFPYSVYSPSEGKNDYTDDINARSRIINYLSGNSVYNPKEKGLGVPFEMTLGVHSDAGFSKEDDLIGTLGIYTTDYNNGELNAGISRYASRDLADMVLTGLQQDISAQFGIRWQRRSLWNRNYSETRLPAVPSMILELLSHQNFADLKLGHDPRFKFTVGRSVYKSILKYLSTMHGTDYVVQPLPVNNFAIHSGSRKNTFQLTWQAVDDPLEPTAKAQQYIVYTRLGHGGFDNGTLVRGTEYTFEAEPGLVYSFKVTAVNKGGESFPSEILSAYQAKKSKGTILIVNAFVSCSDEAVENGFVRLADYPITDLIFGADRRPFSHTLQQLLTTYCQGGGNLMLSGSYIGSNMNSPTALNFTENILKYSFGGSMINSTSGEIYGANTRFSIPRTINEQTYAVPAPDCLTPIAPAYSAFVYNPGSYSAGVAYKGKYRTFVLGFPFESIQGVKERARVMSAILGFFGSK